MNAPIKWGNRRNVALALWQQGKSAFQVAEVIGDPELGEQRVKAMVIRARAAGDPRAINHPRGFGGPWTAGRVALLRDMWSAGKTCSAIASALGGGLTKNAVIGKRFRLKLPERGTVAKAARAERRVRGERKPAPKNPKTGPAIKCVSLRAEPLPPPNARHVRLLDLQPGDCRFPIGDPRNPDFSFCGCPRHKEFPYCEYHVGLSYQAPRPRGQSAPSQDGYLRNQIGSPKDRVVIPLPVEVPFE